MQDLTDKVGLICTSYYTSLCSKQSYMAWRACSKWLIAKRELSLQQSELSE